jgi:membrane-bound lytic murein transglycosylase D
MFMFKYGILIVGCCCAVLTACAHHKPYGDERSGKITDGIYHRSVPDDQEHAATDAEGGRIGRQGRSGPGQDANQRLVDSALELYQKSQDYWDRGDLEHALDALDESYALIVRVDQDVDESILQQKEDLRYTIAKRIMEVYASRLSAVNGPQDAIPLVMNKHVETELASFRGRERNFIINSYVRSGRFRPDIVKALREEGMPEELSWLPLIESGFQTNALSTSRALGLWQFIASTGYKFGLERNEWVDHRMDPQLSTRAAIAYLKELHGIFGDWTTALAAYNCGEGTVLRIIRSQKIGYLDNFWDLYERLPRETASYVPRFIAVVMIMKDPERFGFKLPPAEKPLQFEEVIITRQMHLNQIASSLNVSPADLKALNPSLRKEVTPFESYAIRVPAGKAQVLKASIDAIPAWKPPVAVAAAAPASASFHTVRAGETLSSIAEHYGTSVQAIMGVNRLKKSGYIEKGWRLKLPAGKKSHAAGQVVRVKQAKSQYVVKRGDTLWKIANRFGTSAKELQMINQLRGTALSVGQVLMIPSGLGS